MNAWVNGGERSKEEGKARGCTCGIVRPLSRCAEINMEINSKGASKGEEKVPYKKLLGA